MPDSYSQNMMTWRKYDFVPDSYSQNMMAWYKYDFVPIIYVGSVETHVGCAETHVGCAETLIFYLLTYSLLESRTRFSNMDVQSVRKQQNYAKWTYSLLESNKIMRHGRTAC